jgi:hypothetical protein
MGSNGLFLTCEKNRRISYLYTDTYNIIHYAVVPSTFYVSAIHHILERLCHWWCWCKEVHLGPMPIIDWLYIPSINDVKYGILHSLPTQLAWLGLASPWSRGRSKVLSLRVLVNHSRYCMNHRKNNMYSITWFWVTGYSFLHELAWPAGPEHLFPEHVSLLSRPKKGRVRASTYYIGTRVRAGTYYIGSRVLANT